MRTRIPRRTGGVLVLALLAACGGGNAPAPPGPSFPPVDPMDVTFVDVTAAAQIDYSVLAGQAGSETEMMSGGAAAGDVDGDGWVDLLVTRVMGPPILYRNLGDGTFEDATPAGLASALTGVKSNGAAFGDIDEDGDLDLYVSSTWSLRYHLFVNDGTGDLVEDALARGAAIETSVRHFGFSVAVGDYDLDGYLDIYVGEWLSQHDPADVSHSRLLRNLGAAAPGHFEDVTTAAGVSLDQSLGEVQGGTITGVFSFSPRFADMDDDGRPDLVIACDFKTSRLFWNEGGGVFSDGTQAAGVGTDENGMGSTVGDFDGDGDLDWFVTSIYDPNHTCVGLPCTWQDSGNRLYRNEGGRVFTDWTDAAGVRQGGWGWGASFADLDSDGDLDLVMTNGMGLRPTLAPSPFETDPMRLWQNEGGWFAEVSADVGVTDDQMGRALLTFDYDQDGDLDLFVVNSEGTPVLYRNDGGNVLAWLQITLEGTASNTEGIGTRLTATADATRPELAQVHEMDGGSNYLAQSERLAHFGFGPDATSVAELQLRWPAGGVETFFDLPVRVRLHVIEGVGLVGDLDGDRRLTAADAVALDLALTDPVAFAQQFPGVDAARIGDVDRSGALDPTDATALAALLP